MTWFNRLSGFFSSRSPQSISLRDMAEQMTTAETGLPYIRARAAFQLSTVERCINVISNMWACLPVHVVRYKKSGGFDRVDEDHPAWWLLNRYSDINNPYSDDCLPAFYWRQAAIRQTLASGNSCLPIDRNDRMQPVRVELQRTPADCKPEWTRYNQQRYSYTDRNGRYWELLPFDVLHFRNSPLDGFIGRSPIAIGAPSVDLSIATEDRAAQLINDGRPGGFIQVPHGLNDDAVKALRENWDKMHTEGKHRLGVLTHGADWKTYGFDSQTLELMAQREFQVTEMCRWFGVPPHLVFQGKEKSQNTAAQLLVEFLIVTLIPFIEGNRNILENRFLTWGETHRAGYGLWFDRDTLESADPTAWNGTLIRRIQNGVMTINDWRDIMRQPHIEGGDEPLVMSSQMTPLNLVLNPPKDPAKMGNPTDPTKKKDDNGPTES